VLGVEVLGVLDGVLGGRRVLEALGLDLLARFEVPLYVSKNSSISSRVCCGMSARSLTWS